MGGCPSEAIRQVSAELFALVLWANLIIPLRKKEVYQSCTERAQLQLENGQVEMKSVLGLALSLWQS